MTSDTRPQARRSRTAILETVTRLIREEGASAITHQRVAQEAGVGRATVYRHWPQPADLLFAALESTELSFLEPRQGSFRDRVDADLHRIATDLNAPGLTSIAMVIIERSHAEPKARALRDRLIQGIVQNTERAIDEAFAAGELKVRPSPDVLVDLALGPLWSRRLFQGTPIDDELVDAIMTSVVDPLLAAKRG